LLPELELLFLELEDGHDDELEELAGLLKFVSEGCTVTCIEA
jgi:hypothetical protein